MLRSIVMIVIAGSVLGSTPTFAQVDCGSFCVRYCGMREPGPGYDNGNCQIGCMHGCYWYLSEQQGQLPKPAVVRRHKPAASYR